jgi:hypothetical protein
MTCHVDRKDRERQQGAAQPPQRERAVEKARKWLDENAWIALPDAAAKAAFAERFARALDAERAEVWEEAAKEHQRHCVSLACRDNKVPCNECETYRARAAALREKEKA